jgi:transposase
MKTVAGLDVHKDTIFLCILKKSGEKILQEFTTLTPDIEKMRDLMKKETVEQVAMESTGIYWIPVWRILQGCFELKLVNPYFIKQLPGRKTDVKDAQWIAECLQKELIRGSYIPEKHIQELRQYERRYVHLCEEVTRAEQEIDRLLHRCNIRITNFAAKIGSLSVMKVVKAIIEGKTQAQELEKLIHGRIRNKHKEKIKASLTGVISEADRFLFKQHHQLLELLTMQKEECVNEMDKLCEQYYKAELKLLITIPGVQKLSAMIIIAEMGVNLKTFATAANLVGWVGLRPRNDESAKKIKSRKITKGNKYLRKILVQCAWAITRKKGCWLKTKFEQLCIRMSSRKALIAIARKLLVIIWNILSKKEDYKEFKPKSNPEKLKRKKAYYQKQLEELEKLAIAN